jgi:hypothetical protein
MDKASADCSICEVHARQGRRLTNGGCTGEVEQSTQASALLGCLHIGVELGSLAGTILR